MLKTSNGSFFLIRVLIKTYINIYCSFRENLIIVLNSSIKVLKVLRGIWGKSPWEILT